MKQALKTNLPLMISAVLGAAAAVLRTGLYTLGVDEKNLIASGHLLEILVWIVTAAALGLLVFLVLPLKGSNRYEDNFRPSLLRAAGSIVLAVGIAASSLSHWDDGRTSSDLIRNALGILSSAGMVWVALCRVRGHKPFFLCHALVCMYCCAYLLGQYRIWSSNPQLQDYVFFLMGCVCMGLYSYQQAAFDVGLGGRRKLLLYGLVGGFCAIAAVYGAYDLPLTVCGAVWMLTNLCSIVPHARYLK